MVGKIGFFLGTLYLCIMNGFWPVFVTYASIVILFLFWVLVVCKDKPIEPPKPKKPVYKSPTYTNAKLDEFDELDEFAFINLYANQFLDDDK